MNLPTGPTASPASRALAPKKLLLNNLVLLLALLLSACGQSPTAQDWTASVVRIEAVSAFNDPAIDQPLQISGGSGFIVDDSGLVVTNNHVVGGASLVQIFLPGEEKPRSGRVVGVSECSDLALVQLEGDGPFTPIPWYDGPINVNLDVRKGGYPGGSADLNVQDGIVAQLNVPLHSMWASLEDALAHSAKVLGGDSGGVLVAQEDGQWKVVAVNFASVNADDQNYAIGRDEVQAFIAAVKADAGASPVALDGAIGINGVAVQGTLRGEEIAGIWVRAVIPGSPADKALLQPGDLITTMGGLPLAADGSMQIYCQFVRGRAAEPQNIEVLRLATGERLAGQLNTDRPLVETGSGAPQVRADTPTPTPDTPPAPAPTPGVEAAAAPPADRVRAALALVGEEPQNGELLDYQPGPLTLVLNQHENRGGYGPIKGEVSDFVLHTDVVWGEASHQCEVYSRTSDRNGYDIFLRSDGAVVAGWLDNGTWRSLGEERSPAINTGPGASNNLVIAARGTSYSVFVNGQEVLTFEHEAHAKGGVYLWAWDTAGPNATPVDSCSYSETWLWALAQ